MIRNVLEVLFRNMNWMFFIVWLIAGMILAIMEIFMPGTFFFLVLGVAAVGAGLICLVPFVPWWISFFVFAFLAVLGTFAAKRFADRVSTGPVMAANVDRYLGKKALVIETVDPVANKGRVRVDQDEWRAISDLTFEKGTWVIVEAVEGTCLRVKASS